MITRGTLDGEFHGTPRSVIVATEDPWSETIVPRLIAAGADLNRVYRCDVRDRKGAEIGPVEMFLPSDKQVPGNLASRLRDDKKCGDQTQPQCARRHDRSQCQHQFSSAVRCPWMSASP